MKKVRTYQQRKNGTQCDGVCSYHVVFDGGASNLSIVEHFQPLEVLAGGDVCQTLVRDLHTTVQLQHGQVLRDGRTATEAANTLVSDPTTVRHTLHTTKTALDVQCDKLAFGHIKYRKTGRFRVHLIFAI